MENLVRIVDKGAAEDCSKRGEAIATEPIGFAWSEAERTNPDWIILVVNGMINTDRAIMHGNARNLPNGRFRRRDWLIDLDALPNPERFAWPRQHEKVTLTRREFVAALKRLPDMV